MYILYCLSMVVHFVFVFLCCLLWRINGGCPLVLPVHYACRPMHLIRMNIEKRYRQRRRRTVEWPQISHTSKQRRRRRAPSILPSFNSVLARRGGGLTRTRAGGVRHCAGGLRSTTDRRMDQKHRRSAFQNYH